MARGVRAASLVSVLCIAVPSIVYAQASITGVVRDTSGAVLPGVTVEAASPALIEGVRSAVTDGTGRYRIEELRPGSYVLTFTLSGFTTVRREGIQLTGTAVTTVNADLRVGAIVETITVTGEVPTVDVQSTVRQRVLDREVLELLPSSRAPSQMAALTPNVTPGRFDVGGTAGDGSARGGIEARGVDDSRIMIGGLVTQTGTGTSHGVYNMEAYQEVVVDSGAVSAEYYTGGVRINFIPRDGGNTFSGSFLGAYANNDMSGNNVTQELRDGGLSTPNSVKQFLDINPALGGPLKRDRVWFHVAGRYDRAYNFTAVHFNKNAGDPNAWTYEPDLSREAAATENTIRNVDIRLTWQATARNKFAATYDNSRVCDCPRQLRGTESPEAIIGRYNINPRRFWGAEWSAPVSSRLLLEANFVKIHSDAARARVNPYFPPSPVPLIAVREQSTGRRYRGTPSAPRSINDPFTARAVMSYVTGTHSLKAGFNFGTVGQRREQFSPDAPLEFRFNRGVPNRLTQVATPYTSLMNGVESAIFVQDRWTIDRLTLSGGVRYDYFYDWFPEHRIGPGNFVPNRNIVFPKTDGVRWHDLSPRIGLAYDVFGTGRTALKVSLNRYLGGEGSGSAFGLDMAPASTMVTQTTRSWRDANGDFVPDCDLTSPAGNGECGAMADRDFGRARSVLTYDPDITRGWGKRFSNWQFATGGQHEIVPRVSVGVEYWRTWFGNLPVIDHRGFDPEDFDEYSITAPRDPRLPGGGGYVIAGLFDVKPEAFGRPASGFVARANRFGKMIERWNGVDFTLTARPREGVLLQGGATTQRRSTNTCDVVIHVSPESPPGQGDPLPVYNPSRHFCDVEGTFLTQAKFLGSYRIPRADVQLSVSLQNLPGPEILATYTAPNAEIRPSLGRDLAGGERNVEIPIVEPRSMYGDRVNQVDIRIAKILRFGRARATAGVDVYNAFNSSAVLDLNDAFDRWQRPLEIINARFAKVVFQLNF